MSAVVETAARPSPLKLWVLASRPKTLSAAIAPVVVGTGLAYGQGVGRAGPAIAALLGSVLIQIGTNFLNDYYDFKKGADTKDRVGPMRVTQAGLIAPGTVLRAGIAAFAAAAFVGLYLVFVGGWPIVAIGLLSLLSGWAYTGGPYPLAYLGLGDVFVFLFFGLAAVGGTYYVQAGHVSAAVWPVACAMGAMATAILITNNLRDVASDAATGKRTLIVRLGAGAGRAEYVAMLAVAFAAPIVLWAFGLAGPACLVSLASFALAAQPLYRVFKQSGRELNPALGETGRLQFVYALLLGGGLLFS